MRKDDKPVRKCHACLLNLGDRCWLYRFPRGQWRDGRTCRTLGDEAVYEDFRRWQKRPTVKTRKELRQEVFRARARPVEPRSKRKSRRRYR
jgi:hypothetical protein